ncbi:cell division control protein 6 homolog [Elaeis guineensis]|uniref:Cell division control protein n=1 Tax=Elaeis guineensis var. tenera TaxID=51953 RepID=A0A8N4FB20_ELAGV|nr:cell division control protein 6 homolog [Elaeis guineensis]
MAKTRSANCGPACLNRSPDSEAVVETTENRKRSRSQFPDQSPIETRSPAKWRPPRGCKLLCSPKSPRKRLSDQFSQRSKWNPRDPAQMQAVKEALHVATVPTNVACREDEQKRILEFCKACIEQEKAGSLYVCGSPGTGKSLSVDKVKDLLAVWSKEVGFQSLDTLAINCTSLPNTSEIFGKILEKFNSRKKTSNGFSPLQDLQNLFSQKKPPSSGKMMLIIVDEMDYLITKDCAVLHNLFMLTTFPFSRCILIGIANAIDLADRFLPKLESLNCKPLVITFRAYSKDQILKILHQRLMVLQFDVFQPLALEFCARKVAAASGDMRRALGVCRSAVEVLEAQLRDATRNQDTDIVMFDHMDIALSKAFKSAVVDTIQALPQHQQVILCSLVKLFRQCKKNATTLGELNKSYLETCKSSQIPAVGTLEFTNLCKVLSDQGLLKLGQSREDKLKRVTLQIDSSDIIFAFKGIRFFQTCLE